MWLGMGTHPTSSASSNLSIFLLIASFSSTFAAPRFNKISREWARSANGNNEQGPEDEAVPSKVYGDYYDDEIEPYDPSSSHRGGNIIPTHNYLDIFGRSLPSMFEDYGSDGQDSSWFFDYDTGKFDEIESYDPSKEKKDFDIHGSSNRGGNIIDLSKSNVLYRLEIDPNGKYILHPVTGNEGDSIAPQTDVIEDKPEENKLESKSLVGETPEVYPLGATRALEGPKLPEGSLDNIAEDKTQIAVLPPFDHSGSLFVPDYEDYDKVNNGGPVDSTNPEPEGFTEESIEGFTEEPIIEPVDPTNGPEDPEKEPGKQVDFVDPVGSIRAGGYGNGYGKEPGYRGGHNGKGKKYPYYRKSPFTQNLFAKRIYVGGTKLHSPTNNYKQVHKKGEHIIN